MFVASFWLQRLPAGLASLRSNALCSHLPARYKHYHRYLSQCELQDCNTIATATSLGDRRDVVYVNATEKGTFLQTIPASFHSWV